MKTAKDRCERISSFIRQID